MAAWLPPGEYARADPIRRAAWLAGVAADLRDDKVRQVESGIGGDGRPMPRVLPTSRPDGTRDRPLIPHDDESRTIRFLKVTANNRTGVVTFHWNAWTRILGYHARGKGKPLPKRDVFGTPGRFLRKTKAKARASWRAAFPFLPQTLRLEAALVAPRGFTTAPAPAAPPRPVAAPVARKRFGPSRATVTLARDPGEATILARARAILGRPVTRADLAGLAGAPDASRVRVSRVGQSIHLKVTHQDFRAHRVLLDDGRIHNVGLYVKAAAQGRGLGASILGRQVEHARRLGVARLITTADRDDAAGSVGYAVWPRLGYDGPIPTRIRPLLPEGLSRAKDVSDLMRTPEGRAWWATHGVATPMDFPTRRDSAASRMLRAYLLRRGIL